MTRVWQGEVRRRHVALLAARGRTEDAVEALLDAGDADEGWRYAVDVLPLVVERMDLAQAARWLDALDAVHRPPVPAVTTVVLRVAFGLEQYRRGAALWDVHGPRWVDELVRDGAPEPVVLLVWCLWHLGRLTEARRAAAMLPEDGWHRRVAETVLALSVDDPPPLPGARRRPGPAPSRACSCGSPTPGAGSTSLRDPRGPGGPWREVQGAPWRIAALRAAGRLDEALAEWELRRGTDATAVARRARRRRAPARRGPGRRGLGGPGPRPRAGARLGLARSTASLVAIYETRAHLRVGDDLDAARRALARADAEGADDHAFTRDLAVAVPRGAPPARGPRGRRGGDPRAVRGEHAAAVTGCWSCPPRPAISSEAQARRGGADALRDAAASAALAMRVADERGSEALLLAALAGTCPGWRSARPLEAAGPDAGRWRALLDRAAAAVTTTPPAPRRARPAGGVREPASCASTAGRSSCGGARRSSCWRYLLSRPHRAARREEILDALFFGRDDRGAASYLRQCLHRLRAVLPAGVELSATANACGSRPGMRWPGRPGRS